MKPRRFAPRILAVVLSACLILPPHAYALRPQQREAEPQRTGLEEALRSGDPDALIRVASSRLTQWISPAPVAVPGLPVEGSSAVPIGRVQAGMEEAWDKHPEALPILERYPDPAVRSGVFYGETDPESGRDHVRRVLRIAQLLAEDAGLSDEDQRLLRIAAALHDVGSLQHLDVAGVMEILKLARKKITVPFRLRDLADHYRLTWETVGELFGRIRADLGQNFTDKALTGPVRPDVAAIQILDELALKGDVRFDAPADRKVVEAVIRESVWAGLLATQPGYTAALAREVVERAQRLAEFLEAADTVEASANLARAETLYSGRPRDLANLIWSLGAKVREQAISREMAARVLGFLGSGHPRYGELIAILEKSRRIGQAGQAWSELDRQIMARVEAGATLEELQAGLAVQELIGEDLVQGQRWPEGVPKTLGVVPDNLVQQFVKTWTARAQAGGIDLNDPDALRAYLRREIIPWRIYPAAGRASRVSATGLIRKAVVRADGYSTSVRQAREPVNWGDVEDVIVVDAVIGYQMLREGARVGQEVREELADRISKKEIPALAVDFGRSADKADEEAGKQKDAKKAAGLREAAKLYRQAQQDLPKGVSSIGKLVKGGWELATDPKQENDVAHLLREMEKILFKTLPEKELAQYVGEQLAAVVLRRLIEEKGKPYSEDFVDPARVRDVLGERVILAVASPDGPGGAFREGIRRLRDWDRLNEHAYIMPVYSDYPSASLDIYPNPYLVGLLVGLSNPGGSKVLPKVVTSAKSPLKSLPYAKGNVVFKDSARPEDGAVAIREWRPMTPAEQTGALAGFGRSLKQQDVPEAALPSVENWGKLTQAEQGAVKQGYRSHTPVPGAQPFYHALNAGIFLFETALVEKLINGGVWTPYGNYDHPDVVKFKPHEYWYTDLVEAAAAEGHVARVVPLGPEAPDGLKDTGRIVGYAADRNTMVAGLLTQHGVKMEPGATVTISSASATFSPAVDLPRMFPGTATLKGRVHLDTTVTVGEGAILDGTDRPVVLLGKTAVPNGVTITGVKATDPTFTGLEEGTSVDWRVGNQIPDGAILLAPGEMDWLRTQGVVVAEDALVYLMPVEGVSLASPKDRQPVLKGIFGGETDQVWLEGRIALEPAVRIAKGTWLNGWHRPVVLRGRTQIGQGRSVAAAELTDTVLEPMPVLDGFNYEPPRVGQDTDVWNAILVGQVIPLGRQVHDAIAGVAVENQSRKGRLRRLGQIVVDPQRYVPGVARLAERDDKNQKGLIGFVKKEIVGMFEDKIVGKEIREGAIKALERFLAHPAALQLTNEELYQMGFLQMQYLAGGADPFAPDKQGPERDAVRQFATRLIARALLVDLQNKGQVAVLLDELTLHAVRANFLDRQSESARKVFGQPGFFDDFEKNLSEAVSSKLEVDGRSEWKRLALDTGAPGTFLYLVDNVEETEVDAALWVLLARMGHTVVVGAKSGAARSDATVEDVRQIIDAHEVLRQLEQAGRLRLVGTGSQTYGTLLDRASDELIQALTDPNLRAVVMKGQGNLFTTVSRNAMKVPVVTLLLSKGEDAAMATLGIQEKKNLPPLPVPIIAVVPSGRHLISRVTPDSGHPKGFGGSLQGMVEEEWKLEKLARGGKNYEALVRIFRTRKQADQAIQAWMRRSHLTFRQAVLGQLHERILGRFLEQDPEGFVQRQRELERYNAIFFGGGSASQTNQEVRLQSPRLEKQWMHTVSVTNGTDNGGRTARIQQAMQPHYGHTFTVGDITAAFKGMFSSEVQDRLLEPDHVSIWANGSFWSGKTVKPTFATRVEWLLTDFAKDPQRLTDTPDFVRLAVELLNLAAVADRAFVHVHDVNLPSVRHVIFNAIMEAVDAYSVKRKSINPNRFRVGLYLLEQAFGLPHRILHNSLDPLELYAELTDSKGSVVWKSTETFNTPEKIGAPSVYSVGEHGQVAISLSPDAAKPGVKVQYQTLGFIDPSAAAQGTIDLVIPEAEPDVIQAIQQAEPGAMVVFGPSSFVVSLSSIFLPKFIDTLHLRPDLATTLVLNLTRNSETLGWTAADYIRFWEERVTGLPLEQTVQYLVINNKQPDEQAKAKAEQLAQAAGNPGQPNYPAALDQFDPVKYPGRELILALAFADHGESRETYKERGGVPPLTDQELLDLVNRGVTIIRGDLVATEGWKYTPGKGRVKRYGAFHNQEQLAKVYEIIMAEHQHRLAQEEKLKRGGLIELPSTGLEEVPIDQLAADWSKQSSVTLDVRVRRLDMADKEAYAARTNQVPHSYLVYELVYPETEQVVSSMMVGFSPADVSPNDVILADVTMDQKLGGTALDVQFLRWIVRNTLDSSVTSLRHRHWEDPEERDWAIRLSRSEQARQELVNDGRFEKDLEDIPQYGIRMDRVSSAAWKTGNLPEEDVWFRGQSFPLPVPAEPLPVRTGLEEKPVAERTLAESVPLEFTRTELTNLLVEVRDRVFGVSDPAGMLVRMEEVLSSGNFSQEEMLAAVQAVVDIVGREGYSPRDSVLEPAVKVISTLVRASYPDDLIGEYLNRWVADPLKPDSLKFLAVMTRFVPDHPAWRQILTVMIGLLSHTDTSVRETTQRFIAAATRNGVAQGLLSQAFFSTWRNLLGDEPGVTHAAQETLARFIDRGIAVEQVEGELRRILGQMRTGMAEPRKAAYFKFSRFLPVLFTDEELVQKFHDILQQGTEAALSDLRDGFKPAESVFLSLVSSGQRSPLIRQMVAEGLSRLGERLQRGGDVSAVRAYLTVARLWSTSQRVLNGGEGEDYFYEEPWKVSQLTDFLVKYRPEIQKRLDPESPVALRSPVEEELRRFVAPLTPPQDDVYRDEGNRWERQNALASLAALGLLFPALTPDVLRFTSDNLKYGGWKLRETSLATTALLQPDPMPNWRWRISSLERLGDLAEFHPEWLGRPPSVSEVVSLMPKQGDYVNRLELLNVLALLAELDLISPALASDVLRVTVDNLKFGRWYGKLWEASLATIEALRSQPGLIPDWLRQIFLLERSGGLLELHPEWLEHPPSIEEAQKLAERLSWLPPVGGKIPLVIEGDARGVLRPSWTAEEQAHTISRLRRQGELGTAYVHQLTVQGRLPDEFKYVALVLILAGPYRNDWTQPFFEAHWGKVAPLVHDGGNVNEGLNPLWEGVKGRTDFIQRVAKVYLKDLEVLEGLPESGQIQRRKDLQSAESEAYERARLMLETKAYQRLALALHAKMGTAPQEIPSDLREKLKQHWVDFEGQMRALLGEFGLKGAAEVTWFTEEARPLIGWDKPRQEAPWEPIQRELIHLEEVRQEYPQPLFNRANQILQEVTDAIDRDLGLSPASGLEEVGQERGQTRTLLRSDVSGPVMMEMKGIPQTVFLHRISVSDSIRTVVPGSRLLLTQEGVLPPAVTAQFAARGWKVETLPAEATPKQLVGEVQAGLKEWTGSVLVVAATGMEEAVGLLPMEARLTTVFVDRAMVSSMAPNVLLAYLVQSLEAFPGGIRRLESVTQAGVEEFQAISSQL